MSRAEYYEISWTADQSRPQIRTRYISDDIKKLTDKALSLEPDFQKRKETAQNLRELLEGGAKLKNLDDGSVSYNLGLSNGLIIIFSKSRWTLL